MNNRGFTLLELLIVVLLIGILGAAALPQYFNAVERQRVTEALTILSAIEKAQVRYNAVNDVYSTDFSNIDFDLRSNVDNPDQNASGDNFKTNSFEYKLESTKVVAKRLSGMYQLEKIYITEGENSTDAQTCCTALSREDICDIIDITPCGS